MERSPGEVIRDVIDNGKLRMVFQPLVDLTMHKTFAYEALVRCTEPGLENPLKLLEMAIRANMSGELGRVLRRLSIEGCPDAPLFLNIHPNEFGQHWLVRPDDPIYEHEHPIYLEITESVPLSHFEYCHGVLTELRGKGINLAVDDLGAGYSNLKYIADLQPEVVKIDRELVRDLKPGTRLMTLVKNIVRLCVELGAKVVAEGIETELEFNTARDCGAHIGQGYYIARPAFPPPGIVRMGLEPPT